LATEEAKEVTKPTEGFTIRVVVIAAVLTAIFLVPVWFLRQFYGQDTGMWGGSGTEMSPMPYSIIFIAMLVSTLVGKKLALKPQELAVLLGMTCFISTFQYGNLTWAVVMICVAGNLPWITTWKPYIPSWWVNTDLNVVQGAWTGGAAVPWGPLLPYIAVWSFYYFIVVIGIIFFTMTLIQRKFFQVDKLPFPGFVPGVVLLEHYSETVNDRPKLFNIRKSKWFWLGFLAGGVWAGPSVLSYIVPWLWAPTHVFGRIPLDSIAPIFAPLGITGWWFIDLNMIPIQSLMPIDVLATMCIFDLIVYWIYPPIGRAVGNVSPTISIWNYYYGTTTGGIAFLAMQLYGGTMLGCGIWVVLSSWRFLKNSLVNAVKGAKTEVGEIPERWIWAGLGILWVCALAFWVAAGGNILIQLWSLILYTVYLFGAEWLYGYQILWLSEPYNNWGAGTYIQRLGYTAGLYTNPSTNPVAINAGRTPYAYSYSEGNWNGALGVLYGYRLTGTTKATPKAMFFGLLTIMVVYAIIAIPIELWVTYTWGASTKLYRLRSAGPATAGGVLSAFGLMNDYQLTWMSIGVILPTILMILRTRFPWFFIHPAAFVMWPISHGIIHFAPALALKVGALRIGGAKGYSDVWVPIVAGFAVGTVTFGLFGNTALALRVM